MSLEKLTFQSMDDGAVLKAIESDLDKIARDVIDNSVNVGARKLTVTVEMVPVTNINGNGELENRPKITCSRKITWPDAKIQLTSKVEGGEIKVNSDFPRSKNPDEQALPGMGSKVSVKIMPPRAAEGE